MLSLALLFFMILSPIAIAQGGYDVHLSDSSIVDQFDQYPMSFWQLPDWVKLFYVTSMAAAFIGLLKLMPLVLGKIDDILKNENRHNILNYINANPGTTIAKVTESQQIERATVRYHLYKLESEGKIVSRKMGKFSRLFRNSRSFSDEEQKVIAHMQNRNSRAILLLILEQPGITNQELTECLGIEKSAIHWHLEKFIHDDIVNYIPDGKFKRYFIQDSMAFALQKHTEQALT
jgi:predicted transcriptional regulator